MTLTRRARDSDSTKMTRAHHWYVVLSEKFWRALVYMNWIASHRRVDEGVTIGNCRMNHLLFADELVLHAWIF